jgi:hypothetical protein
VTIPTYLHDAVMRLPPEERLNRVRVNEAVRLADLTRSDHCAAREFRHGSRSSVCGETARVPLRHLVAVQGLSTLLARGNDLSTADRSYVAKVVSAHTGLSQADAEKRVNDVVTQVKAVLDEARSDADRYLADPVAVHRGVLSVAHRDRGWRPARRNLGKEGLRHAKTKGETPCRFCFGSSEFRFR